MKRMFLISFFLALSVQAQTLTEIFSGYAVNDAASPTLGNPANFQLTGPSGNLFDSLNVFLQGGTESTTDSVRCGVYVQSAFFGRWSQPILIDTLLARGAPALTYNTTSLAGMLLKVDSLKNRWFYGTSISGSAKTALMVQTGWLARIYTVGTAYAPLIGSNTTNGNRTTGGLVKVFRLKW